MISDALSLAGLCALFWLALEAAPYLDGVMK